MLNPTTNHRSRLSRSLFTRAVGWCVAGFMIAGGVYVIGFLVMSMTTKTPRHVNGLVTLISMVPYAAMLWVFLGLVTLPLLLATTFALAVLCRRIERLDSSLGEALLSAVVLASITVVLKVIILERPVGLVAILDRYYALEWVALICGMFLSRVLFKSLRPGSFYIN